MDIKDNKAAHTQIELVVDSPIFTTETRLGMSIIIKQAIYHTLTRFHAGYFRITLSLCSQALLWKVLVDEGGDYHLLRRVFRLIPLTAFLLLWLLSLLILVSFSFLYITRCFLHFDMVKAEFLHKVGVNYLFAPSISWLLLLQSAPFVNREAVYYTIIWWVLMGPVLVLDVKIYGQWFTKGKRFLSTEANPTSQLSVIANLVGAWTAARREQTESAICMFSLGITHYCVLFVTLYQRLPSNDRLPLKLRPVFFLFFAAPSTASLAWDSIIGKFDSSSKMLFFLWLFLFMSLVGIPLMGQPNKYRKQSMIY